MLMLGVFSLAAPLMLAGLTLLSLPVAAHLMNRRARRRIVFPTISFLMQTAASQSRLYRLRRWLLLLLRCLAVIFIVLAFTRPSWLDQADAAAGKSGGAGCVLLVDVSASTQQNLDGAMSFRTLVTAGQRTLDQLEPGRDTADLVIASAQPRAVFGELSTNLDLLRTELAQLDPTDTRANIAVAIAMASEILESHQGPRQLVILSDRQLSNWQDALTAGAQDALPPGTRISIVDDGHSDTAPGNITLAEPATDPPVVMTGRPLRVAITAVNNSNQSASGVAIALRRNGQTVATESVALEPWGRTQVWFDEGDAGASPAQYTFAIERHDDALAVDDAAHLAVMPLERLAVAVISDEDADAPGNGSYFLVRAIAPHGDETDHITVTHMSSATIAEGGIEAASVIFLGDCARLDEQAAATLAQRINAGASAVMLLGDGPAAENLGMIQQSLNMSDVEQAVLGPRMADALLRVGNSRWDDPLFRAFDLRSQAAFRQIMFHRIWHVESTGAGAHVLLQYENDLPAMWTTPVGRGRLVIANFSPAPDASALGKFGAVVALMQSLVQNLQPRDTYQQTTYAGSSAMITLPRPQTFDADAGMVRAPDGRALAGAAVEASADVVNIALPHASLPGFYEVVIDEDASAQASVAVNIDPREGDLRRIEQSALLSALGVDDGTTTGSRSNNAVAGSERDSELWPWALLVAMCAIAAELVLLSVWRR
ncbi:MAG: BatA domain-containing protein [Phycisphaerales bacterium]